MKLDCFSSSRKLGAKTNLPVTDRFFETSLLLPLNHLMNDEQVNYVCHFSNSFTRIKY